MAIQAVVPLVLMLSLGGLIVAVGLDDLLYLFRWAIGMAVRRFAPGLAAKAVRIVNALAMALLLIVAIPLFVTVAPALLALVGNGTVIAMALTAAAGLAAGHWLGGPDRQNRAALAMAAAMRHPGMLIVGAVMASLYGARMKPQKAVPA